MSDLLDDMQPLSVRQTDVVDELYKDKPIMECPYICVLRLNTVDIDRKINYRLIEQVRYAINASRGIELLSDFELNCRAEHQKTGSVQSWMFTDDSVYLCFGFDVDKMTLASFKRLLKNIVNGTWRDSLFRYGYNGVLFYQRDGEVYTEDEHYGHYTQHKCFYVESDILETSKRMTDYDTEIKKIAERLFFIC